jgi:hypothetical protein
MPHLNLTEAGSIWRIADMELKDMLAAVHNDTIAFVTLRPRGSPFTILMRRVVVTDPPELVALSQAGDIRALDELVAMLTDPNRAWAAQVLLAALTRREEDSVGAFAADPNDWWGSLGATAHERWSAWLHKARSTLRWDAAQNAFVEQM